MGKKKLLPVNATSGAFKARSVTLAEQAQFAEKKEEVSKRNCSRLPLFPSKPFPPFPI